jgi:hypothetical protein
MYATPASSPTAESRLRIQAPVDVVFRLASEIEFWPTFVRDAASVRILRGAPNGLPERLVEMTGRGWRPLRWRLVQRLESERGRISYRAPGRQGGGIIAEWTLTANEDGAATDVTITQWRDALFPASIPADIQHVAEGGTLAEGH